MPEQPPAQSKFAQMWQALREHFSAGRQHRSTRIADPAGLQRFLETRASHITQTALYGYLRTRAGARYPELFANDEFVRSIDIAKWYIWLACLSDLSIYAGGLVAHRAGAGQAEIKRLMDTAVETILARTGVPAGAGGEFVSVAQRVRARVGMCEWSSITDDETPFTESPTALIDRAPIIEDLKRLDEEIVRNSVRFRWHEVRRDLRRDLDAKALVASIHVPNADGTDAGKRE